MRTPASIERPAMPMLAEGTELLGEFEGSGYREPPQLVCRSDGQVVHLPALLYRLVQILDNQRQSVAKPRDGHQALAQAAEAISQDTEREFTADHIAFLLDRKLAPLGVTTYSDGSPPTLAKASAFLALRFRVAMIPESVTWALGGLFAWLYLPPVMVLLIATTLAVEVWLFGTQNMGAAFQEALLSPSNILLLMLLTVASAAFHEIGHATACRYSGVRPGAMGCGIYLVWPVFYTDVTRTYRLGRLGRIRTDLGGVYFNGIFIIGLVGFFLWTGFEPVLAAVIATNLEIIRQLLPTLRFDGYYIAADVVGIPDLFKYIKPILKKTVLRKPPDERLQLLKRWPQRVLTGWVLIVLPALAAQLSFVAIQIPQLLEAIWQRITTLATSTASNDLGLIEGVTASFQILMLLLPVAGLAMLAALAIRGITRMIRRRRAEQRPDTQQAPHPDAQLPDPRDAHRVLDRLLGKLPDRFNRLRRRIPLRIVVPVGLASILAIALGRPALDQLDRLNIAFFGCDNPPVEFTLLSSPNGLGPARKLAGSYERSTAASNYGCPTANVYVYAVPEKTARQALSNGWRPDAVNRTEPLRDVGPRPDVWLPDSSLEVNRLDSTVKNTQLAANEFIASSPLVLGITASAVPPEMQGDGMSWAALFDQATAFGGGVVRPDPSTSLVGVISTAVLYGIDIDGTGRWTPENPVLDPRVIERRIGLSLDRDRYPLGDETDRLCRHRQIANPRAAVIVSEQQLARFNEGQPLGGECGSAELPSRRNQLVPLYPASTPSLDHRVVRFKWSEPKQAEKAAEFASWLSSEEGRRALADVSLRPAESEGGPVYIASDAAAMDATLVQHNIAQRRGRVLVALDVSGSMAAFAGQDGRSRFDLVSQSIQAALPSMREMDEIGLSLFPGDATGLTARQAVPIGGRDEPLGSVTRRQAIIDELRRITPGGNTPLFRAIADGVAAVGPSDDNRTSGLVVLTDGKDTMSGLTPAQLSAAVQGKEVRVFVLSVGEASCATAPLPEVTTSTGGACYEVDFESVDERVAEVLAVFFGGS